MLHSACTSKVLNHIAKTLPKCCICSTVGFLNPIPFRFPNLILKLDSIIHSDPEHNGLGLKRSKIAWEIWICMIWYSTWFEKSWKYWKYTANICKKPTLKLFTVFCPTLLRFGWISLDPSHFCVWMNKYWDERNFFKNASVRSKLLARPVLSYCICKLTLHYILLFTTV